MKALSVVGGRAGKAEVVPRVVSEFARRGVRVPTVKHMPEAVDPEKLEMAPGGTARPEPAW